MSRLELLKHAIAIEEGFGKPGAIPTRDHNPGDLRATPHALTKDHGIAVEPSDAVGWADLERQIRLDAARDLTVEEFIYKFAPPTENNSAKYLEDVCHAVGCSPQDKMSSLL